MTNEQTIYRVAPQRCSQKPNVVDLVLGNFCGVSYSAATEPGRSYGA